MSDYVRQGVAKNTEECFIGPEHVMRAIGNAERIRRGLEHLLEEKKLRRGSGGNRNRTGNLRAGNAAGGKLGRNKGRRGSRLQSLLQLFRTSQTAPRGLADTIAHCESPSRSQVSA